MVFCIAYNWYLEIVQRNSGSFRFFQRGTKGLWRLKGCKVTSSQIQRFEKIFAARPTAQHKQRPTFDTQDDGIILEVWHTTTLQLFDLQGLIVLLWEDLKLLYRVSTKEWTPYQICLFYHIFLDISWNFQLSAVKTKHN